MSKKYPRENLPPGMSDREAHQLENKLCVWELEKQFFHSPRPETVAQLADECRAFQRELIDGDTISAIVIGRAVIRRWWDSLRLLGENGLPVPTVRDADANNAFIDLITTNERLDELKAAVAVVLQWCNAKQPAEQHATDAKPANGSETTRQPTGDDNAEQPTGAAAKGKTPPAPPQLIVSLDRRTVTFDGQEFSVASVHALRWLKVLSEHPGEWISGADLKRFDNELDGTRTDRVKQHLPDPVQKMIDSATGKGSRLCLA